MKIPNIIFLFPQLFHNIIIPLVAVIFFSPLSKNNYIGVQNMVGAIMLNDAITDGIISFNYLTAIILNRTYQ